MLGEPPPAERSDVPPERAEPPSGDKARIFTLLAAFWLWFLLPIAIYYQRKAFQEVSASGGRYVWPRTLLNRPIVLWLLVLAGSMLLIFAMITVGMYGDP